MNSIEKAIMFMIWMSIMLIFGGIVLYQHIGYWLISISIVCFFITLATSVIYDAISKVKIALTYGNK